MSDDPNDGSNDGSKDDDVEREVIGREADPRESAAALGGVRDPSVIPGAERALTTPEVMDRRARIEASRLAIGWSWMALAEQVGIPNHQGIAVKGGRRTLSEAHIEWLEFLASVHVANPVPDEIGPATGREWRVGDVLQAPAPPPPPPPPERHIPRPVYPMGMAPVEKPSIDREKVTAVLYGLYREAESGALEVSQEEAATVMGTVSQVAQRLGVLEGVRAAVVKARALVG